MVYPEALTLLCHVQKPLLNPALYQPPPVNIQFSFEHDQQVEIISTQFQPSQEAPNFKFTLVLEGGEKIQRGRKYGH